MAEPGRVNRREAIASGLTFAGAAGIVGAGASAREADEADRPQYAQPLAQDFVVVTRTPDKRICTSGPGLVKLPGGELFATVPFWPRRTRDFPIEVRTARSSDGGRTWKPLPPLPYFTACPWMHDGVLYLFAHKAGTDNYRNDDIVLLRSDDGGQSWADPVTLFKGHYWNCPTGIVEANGFVYRAVDQLGVSSSGRGEVVIAGDLSRDLMDRKSWRISNAVPYPGTPKSLRRGFPDYRDHWLEPNVVNVRGRLMVLSRPRIAAQTTANICGVCDLTDDGRDLRLEFTQFYPVPGGQNKLHIIFDNVSKLFWTPATLVTDSQDQIGYCQEARKRREFTGTGGNERRILMLMYSVDALNWFQAGSIAKAPKLRQSFMYACPLIDGQDLLVLSRTSHDARDQHDADLCTFHRVKDFRRLALNLYPEM